MEADSLLRSFICNPINAYLLVLDSLVLFIYTIRSSSRDNFNPSYFSQARQNSRHPQKKGQKVYFSLLFVDVAVYSWLVSKQGSHGACRGETARDVVGKKQQGESSTGSLFPTLPSVAPRV